MTSFWSVFIIVIVVANIAGSAWLLFANARDSSPDKTTGHIWDEDLTEYNKPLPLWWVGLFVGSIVFGIGYLVVYPGLGAFAGVTGWTSAKEHDSDVAAANAKLDAVFAEFRNRPIEALTSDPKAIEIGHNVFANNCIACHGSAARGGPGFPNLTDDDWLYGSSPETIVATITAGRSGVMPPWGAALGDGGVENVAEYVLSLSGKQHDAAKAEAGKAQFMTMCIACHGPDGKGNQTIGAPNLTDDIWLYGGDLASIEATIRNGRNGQMPAWDKILGADRIRLVAAWVLAQSSNKTPQDNQRSP
jgi:cytochrome c oxidase cbb3-type subunit 3